VSDHRLIVTTHGEKEETALPDDAARAAALREWFGVVV
jgi:hypothetical protein